MCWGRGPDLYITAGWPMLDSCNVSGHGRRVHAPAGCDGYTKEAQIGAKNEERAGGETRVALIHRKGLLVCSPGAGI